MYVSRSCDGSRADPVPCQVSKKKKPIFQIRVEDVAQYATAITSLFCAEGLKEDLCETLAASLLDAPESIVEKLMDEDDDYILKSVTMQLVRRIIG